MYFLFTGRWAYNLGGLLAEGGGSLISGSLRYSVHTEEQGRLFESQLALSRD